MKYVKYIKSKMGKIAIIEEEKKIIRIAIDEKLGFAAIEKDTDLLIHTAEQLEQYFEGKRKSFDVPLNPKGTEFMKKVWTSLTKIPYGEVRTYKQIAKEIENHNATRAVGMANHNNPIPIIIPCHRVIGSNGKLVGYALGLDKKEFLLNLEKNNIDKESSQ